MGGRTRAVGWVVAGVLATLGAARAGDAEERVFTAAVDGKPAGEYRMTFAPAAGGGETVTTTARIKVRILLVPYHYDGRTSETWAGGRLAAVAAETDDDGTKATVAAAPAAGGWTVTVNGKAKPAGADLLLLTGTRAPAGPPKTRPVTALDPADGTLTAARLAHVGPGEVRAAGAVVAAEHYKLTGKGVAADWWFDAAGRPVRQEMVCDGHKIVLELADIKK